MGFAGHPIARPRYQFPKSAIQYGARLAHLHVEMLARASHRDLIFRDLARSSSAVLCRGCVNTILVHVLRCILERVDSILFVFEIEIEK